jgi:hypothetical protein
MDIQFVTQPFLGGTDLRDFLESVAEDENLTGVRAAIAWAKRSGLTRVRESLVSIRDRGAVQLIIGISEGGATRQGLELALELATEVYIFHDPTGRTFHPKVYLSSGSVRGLLLVGSHNLTAGGVYYNYEAGLRCELNLNDEDDRNLERDVQSYINLLISDTTVCKRLDAQLLSSLLDDPTYRIGDEDVNRRGPSPSEDQEPDAPEDTDTVTEDETEQVPIFGRSGTAKRPGPAIGSLARTLAERSALTRRLEPRPAQASAGAPAIKRWWKKMSPSDAQKPPNPNSQVTGNLRLSRAHHLINHKVYFRDDFFADAHWIQADPNDPTYEMCHVEMDVTLDDEDLGTTAFRIDYKPSRIAAQNNVPTVLKWGGVLGNRLRNEDHAHEYVVLERLQDGSTRLEIQARDPGPFVA